MTESRAKAAPAMFNTTPLGNSEYYSRIKHYLEAISKLSIPNIGTAATGVQIAMERVQPVLKRPEPLKRAWEVTGEAGEDPMLFAPLTMQLERLAVDISAALDKNRIAAFFNSTDDLNNLQAIKELSSLDGHIQDLLFFISCSTKQTSAALNEEADEAVAALRVITSAQDEGPGAEDAQAIIFDTQRSDGYEDVHEESDMHGPNFQGKSFVNGQPKWSDDFLRYLGLNDRCGFPILGRHLTYGPPGDSIGRDAFCGNTCYKFQIDGKGAFVASAGVGASWSSIHDGVQSRTIHSTRESRSPGALC
ncbi:hypothetical protein C8J56DRAFT_1056817 [Mycena floridula]|nr:hypothetical protein C8J56DRAFT_1056817 [Mycena floridula]